MTDHLRRTSAENDGSRTSGRAHPLQSFSTQSSIHYAFDRVAIVARQPGGPVCRDIDAGAVRDVLRAVAVDPVHRIATGGRAARRNRAMARWADRPARRDRQPGGRMGRLEPEAVDPRVPRPRSRQPQRNAARAAARRPAGRVDIAAAARPAPQGARDRIAAVVVAPGRRRPAARCRHRNGVRDGCRRFRVRRLADAPAAGRRAGRARRMERRVAPRTATAARPCPVPGRAALRAPPYRPDRRSAARARGAAAIFAPTLPANP